MQSDVKGLHSPLSVESSLAADHASPPPGAQSAPTVMTTTPAPTSVPHTGMKIPPSRKHAAHAASQYQLMNPNTHPNSDRPASASAAPAVKRNKLHGSTRKFEQDYVLLQDCMLGSGASGTVYVCTSRRNPTHEYAVKVIKTNESQISMDKFHEEIKVLANIRHHNIIRLKDVYTTDDRIYIVTELAFGGELFDRILKVKSFSEAHVVNVARKLFHAVAYLHSRGIVHRDIKPENILFSTPDADSDLKLTDFGFAKNLLAPSRNLRAKTQTGTAGYMSPEILAGKEYDEKCDTWSLGIVVYIMLSGLPPFVTPEDMEGRCEQPFWLYMNNMRASDGPRPVEFRDDMGWKYVSAQAKHFLASALELDPSKRMRSVDALQHPWLKRRPSHHPTPSMTGSDHSKQNIHQQHHQLNHFLTLTLNRKFDLNKLKEEYGSDEALSPEQAVAEPNFHAEETTAAPPTLDSVLNFSYSPSQPDASTTEAPRSFTSSTTSSTYHSRDSSLASNASSSCSYLARKARQLHYATLPTQYTAEEDDEEEEELQPEFHSSEDEAPVTVTKE